MSDSFDAIVAYADALRGKFVEHDGDCMFADGECIKCLRVNMQKLQAECDEQRLFGQKEKTS